MDLVSARFIVLAGSLLSAGPWAEAHGGKLKLAPQSLRP